MWKEELARIQGECTVSRNQNLQSLQSAVETSTLLAQRYNKGSFINI